MTEAAFIFDMDGVIVPNDRYHYESWYKFASIHGYNISFGEVKSWFGNKNDQILTRLFGRPLSDEEIKSYSEEKELIYRDLYRGKVKETSGLLAFLKAGKMKKIPMALATSAPPENVKLILEETGTRDYFSFITDDSEVINGKPNPEIFIKTAEKLGIAPARCVVFEDSFHGINAARSAGMKVVGVATTHPAENLKNTDLVIENFIELKPGEVLELLNNK